VKKMRKKLGTLMVAGLFLASCLNDIKNTVADDEPVLDTVAFKDLAKTQESPKIRNYRFVPLETNEDCLIGDIT